MHLTAVIAERVQSGIAANNVVAACGARRNKVRSNRSGISGHNGIAKLGGVGRGIETTGCGHGRIISDRELPKNNGPVMLRENSPAFSMRMVSGER